MKPTKFLILILTSFTLLNCSDIKDVKYGKQIFYADYDALLSNDYLKLYDNDLFEIALPNLYANGTYKVIEDTIFFEYFKYTGKRNQAYLMKQGFVYELEKKEGKWIYSTHDTSLGIYNERSSQIYHPEPKYNLLILVESDTTVLRDFYNEFCGGKEFNAVNMFNAHVMNDFENWHSWYFPTPDSDTLVDRICIGHTEDDFLVLGLSFYGYSSAKKQSDNIKRVSELKELLNAKFNVISSCVQKIDYPYDTKETIKSKSDFEEAKNNNNATMKDSILKLPDSEDVLILRTDFSSDRIWDDLCQSIAKSGSELDFQPYVEYLNSKEYSGLNPEFILNRDKNYKHHFIFVVDKITIEHPEHPILCMDLYDKPGETFRVVPAEMWAVENNLSISNVDFEDFLNSIDEDGIYRGLKY